jgi:hypothetical protein
MKYKIFFKASMPVRNFPESPEGFFSPWKGDMMRKIFFVLAVLVLFPLAGPARAADMSFGISVGEEGIESFHLAVGDYFGAPEPTVVKVEKSSIPEEELPVVFFLARTAGVSPDAIVELRLRGLSWLDIALRFGQTAEIFYVPAPSGPHGKAYGRYMGKPKKEWKKLKLSDSDVVNLVNLRFLSEQYGYSVEAIMDMREQGAGFVDIHGRVKEKKQAHAHGSQGGKGKGKKKKKK